jgi:L-alanine-DL-glutamate epimerase-like enolase superfamily enzyme
VKIKSVCGLPLQYPEPHDHNNLRCVTLARVETEDEIVGWGECISQFPPIALAAKTIMERGYAPLLIGEDPLEVERLWDKMLGRFWWYGPQGIAAYAVSAIDMALWDIKGKALRLPVCQLIGSRLHDRVPVMASIHFNMIDLDWTINEFRSFVEEGYFIVKGGWGSRPDAVFGDNWKRDLALVRQIRETIGDDVDLVMDVLGSRVKWSVPHAIRMVREFEPYRLRWIEEPLPTHNYEGYARLRNSVATKVGTGEQEWNREGYRRLFKAGAVDVVQMDPGRCLGITGCRQVIQLVEAENLTYTLHTWSGAINTAASVHLLAISHHGETMDFKPHESPMQHELVDDPWVQKDGYLEVRPKPGLGIAIREDVVKRYGFE